MKIIIKVEDKEVVFTKYKMFEQEKNIYLIGIIKDDLEEEDILIVKNILDNEKNYRNEEDSLVLKAENKFFYFKGLDFNKLAKRGNNIFQIGLTLIDKDNKILEKNVNFFNIEQKVL
jgi:hypothetical protein